VSETAEVAALRAELVLATRERDELAARNTRLGAQIKTFRKLYELGQRTSATRELGQILALLPPFARAELGYERSVVFVDDARNGELRAAVWAGYEAEGGEAGGAGGWAERLSLLSLSSYDTLPTRLRAERTFVFDPSAGAAAPGAGDEIDPLAAALGLESYVACPLDGEHGDLVGILLAGNTSASTLPPSVARGREGRDRREAAYALANLAAQASSAIGNCLLYRALADQRKLLEEKVEQRTRELSEAYADLTRLNSLKSKLFANVSHELRTPLTLSIGPLEELLRRGDELPAADREEYLRTTYNNQLRLLKLINNLLDFSKIDAGKMTSSFQLEDVVGSLRFYVSTIQAAAQSRRMSLVLEADAPEAFVFLDHDKFEKIAMNLLSNAFKFTPDGGRIEVRVRSAGEHVDIDVEDTGVGIAEGAIDTIFDRFSQIEAAEKRPYEGTGIGLAMVKEFVALHGGSIGVASRLGEGTTFTVRFPRGHAHLEPETVIAGLAVVPDSLRPWQAIEPRPPEDEVASSDPLRSPPSPALAVRPPAGVLIDGAASAPSLAPSSSHGSDQGALVLVVDDIRDMRRFLSQLLGKRYRVETARDGLEGLSKARELHPDVIVSDVMMPRMTGYEFCSAIRGDPELSRTPFILLSAKAELARKLEGLEHGADDYLVKPFNASELLMRVRNLIRLHHQERELLNALRELEERDGIITEELQQACEFQQSILHAPPRVPGFEIEVLYRPLELVGGDIYDVEVSADGRIRLFIADATGHGVKASLTTMLIKSEYEFEKRRDAPPGLLLQRLSARVASGYGRLGVHFTAACVEIDPARRTLTCASAAHPPGIVVQQGRPSELPTGGTFMGLVPDAEFPEHERPFEPGDSLYLYTDGVLDEWSAEGDPFGERRLLQAIEEASAEGALAGGLVYDRLDAFIGEGRPQYDDMTLIGLLWGAAPPGHPEETQ
jgi:signal transduction histidine kinase/serine phosphatase RsbU (regulator of sigma subunit)